jgi:hypothetical protein
MHKRLILTVIHSPGVKCPVSKPLANVRKRFGIFLSRHFHHMLHRHSANGNERTYVIVILSSSTRLSQARESAIARAFLSSVSSGVISGIPAKIGKKLELIIIDHINLFVNPINCF